MIHYLKRNQLDILKYDACIETSINARIYAYSWYLDIVADSWDALVLNDYEAVMPIPYLRIRKNLFFKKVIQPMFCQQLGLFSTIEISQTNLNSFITEFLALKPSLYNFNSFNFSSGYSVQLTLNGKVNYELDLNKAYEEIYKAYSKNLKRNLIKTENKTLKITQNISIDDLIVMKKKTKHHAVKSKLFKIMRNLMSMLLSRGLGQIYGVYLNNTLVATAFFIYEPKRIVHLISASTNLGKEHGAIPFLFDNLIKNNIDKNKVFDFEGSMIPGVARFFRGFGAFPMKFNSFQK